MEPSLCPHGRVKQSCPDEKNGWAFQFSDECSIFPELGLRHVLEPGNIGELIISGYPLSDLEAVSEGMARNASVKELRIFGEGQSLSRNALLSVIQTGRNRTLLKYEDNYFTNSSIDKGQKTSLRYEIEMNKVGRFQILSDEATKATVIEAISKASSKNEDFHFRYQYLHGDTCLQYELLRLRPDLWAT
mmetsp:Transcript_20490/g.30349  ORF Transcript_20490/g.30349 Transcript_20490/m.30349 type:complete len:189 (-) Transcript_20490:122-688(-)